ncbi:glycosyltransferase [Nesterenkonia halotolerans]|uniref:glycosyltransferase n=1 Tax=Nesterenkonia halotolerans TaxID=225325 RepID=UPI003EE491DF
MTPNESWGDQNDSVSVASRVPDVSIIVAVHNDEGWIGAALDSCLAQTWENFEVICVDDASTDGTLAVVREFQARDSRVRVFEQEENKSAFQARRVGIFEAKSKYILFLDGDDELARDAVRLSLQTARSEEADLVGFGVEVIAASGDHPRRFESDLQHKQPLLVAEEILPGLFPAGKVAQGHLWRYLWDIRLLQEAYEMLPSDLQLYRANDLPIVFLGVAMSQKYVSIDERLYRYWFRRGGSGGSTVDRAAFRFYLSALDAIESIEGSVRRLALERGESNGILASYESAKLSVIHVVLRYGERVRADEQMTCLSLLVDRVGPSDVIRSAATFFTSGLSYLARNRKVLEAPVKPSGRTVLITAGNLASGGVQGVVVSQASQLLEAGFKVVVAVRTLNGLVHDLPVGVPLVEISGDSSGGKISTYLDILAEYHVDIAIDHWILYKDDWPFFALAAKSVGVPTIGWLHNFALRPMFDFNTRTSSLTDYLPLLRQVVTLSAADVAFWKLRGISQAVYLPNPPSPMLLDRPQRSEPRTLPSGQPLRLVWWGRIQQHTKRVRDLIEVAASLRDLEVPFELTIIGPDSPDLTSAQLRELAANRGVEDLVNLPGPLHGDALVDALEDADIYVCTSAIEGYPLTLIEAQSMGLPVAMYELPWLAVAQDNQGLVTVTQGDYRSLAREISRLSDDLTEYERVSRASLEASSIALNHNFSELYSDLLSGALGDEFSPEPSIEMARILLDRAIDFQEQNSGKELRYQKRILGQLASEKKDSDKIRKRAAGYAEKNAKLQNDLRRLRTWIDRLKENSQVQQQELRRLRGWNSKLRNRLSSSSATND